jgi:hypothetical protein
MKMIQMDLHMVGGFLDQEGTSQQLSQDLLHEWAQLADKYSDRLEIHLKTAAISSLNTTNTTTCSSTARPKSRGLGIDTRTGQVFGIAASLPQHLEGPAMEVRNARLWARANSGSSSATKASLSVIHDRSCPPGQVRIEPFDYQPNPQLDPLLNVPDQVLKQFASTSPDVESDRFCSDLRRTLSFINSVPSSQVFGACKSLPLIYSRSTNNLHEWEHHTTTTT